MFRVIFYIKEGRENMLTIPAIPIQVPLIQFVNEDDQILLNSPEAEWFRILNDLPWQNYRDIAAGYYNALYDFNNNSCKVEKSTNESIESEEEAKLRLLSDRATVNEETPVLYEPEFMTPAAQTVKPISLAPGIVPFRSDGRKPKCFFGLFMSFIGASLMNFPSEPDAVHSLLTSNLSFARVCGFVPKGGDDQYWRKHVPSRRKLEQFDQIMRDYGLWHQAKIDVIKRNITDQVIREENIVVGDTTHYEAHSEFEVVTFDGENGKEKKKSQSKITKNCCCVDRAICPHPWILVDDGAGTIHKSKIKIVWGHKASVIGLPSQGIPLDAVAVSDAATNDGRTFFPHVEKLFDNYPEIQPWFGIALYDAACCNKELKKDFIENFNIVLKTPLNPRKIASVTNRLPRAMDKLTPFGTLTCKGGCQMDYKGMRNGAETYIYQSPIDENSGELVCVDCKHKSECCPNSDKGRTVTISFDLLPHIDPQDPIMAKRFKTTMKKRTSVERMIKRLKCDLGDSRLRKRGNASFQAYLDKTMIAFHILLRN